MEITYEMNHIHELRSYTVAQLVRVSHQYHEFMGSNPVEALNFSGLQAIA